MKKITVYQGILAFLYALAFTHPEAAHASLGNESFKNFAETLQGTLYCRSSDYPIDYTLVGDPVGREVVFSATYASKVVVSSRRLTAKIRAGGLAMTLVSADRATQLEVSALQEDIDTFGDNVDQVRYFYMGSLVHALADTSWDMFTAFHGACRFL